MIPKKEKFITSDFSLIKTLKPRKVFANIGVFCIYTNLKKNKPCNKFAIAPSKKIFKTAVSRNKHKRIYFNFLKNNHDKIKLQDSMCIFYPNKVFSKEMLETEMSKVVL
jgi:ribonuclease P protein component